jgi:hypothetical protein
MKEKARTTFFEKKGAPPGVAKKLLLRFARVWDRVRSQTRAKRSKSFLLPQAGRLFFKNVVLSYFL